VTGPPVGFVGLGNMGSALASNLVAAGRVVIAYDALGPDRAPDGVADASNVAEVARRSEVVVLSLPDGPASEQVAREIGATADRRTTHVIDTSTVGPAAARHVAALLARSGISYIDAPVSGGVAGARARTLTVMVAGPDDACAHVEPVLAGLSDCRYRVGERAGMGQALKLANNFLSATALAATSEAVSFCRSVGLDMETMLRVLNQSSGRSAASSEKFPDHVVTGRYASGFSNSLMAKDVQLYLGAVEDVDGPRSIGRVTAAVWADFDRQDPGVDFTRIFPFVERS
jgi:3-hydroxyisobutyrate dehydrogenase